MTTECEQIYEEKDCNIIATSFTVKEISICEFRDKIKEGMTSDEARKEYPYMMSRYPKFYGVYKNALNQNVKRTWMTEGLWWYGETGTGKSHEAYTKYPDAYFWNSNDKGWWDNYEGQETVIIDNFRGNMPYGTLMQLVDRYPYKVRQRRNSPVPFLAKRVIIISSMSPELVYSKQTNIDQLRRRFTIIKFNPTE